MTKFITLDALKVFLREIKRHIALAVRQQADVTYAELVELRDNAKLIAGRLYRITDYVTKVYSASGFERSAEHPFDIIVRALSENTLAEEAYVAPRKGDEYFANANLNAWKVWYCLDNDVTKYTWADVTNGKGVIYRMIDEWQNDMPYDFKNVQYKRFMVSDHSNNGELATLEGRYLAWGLETDAPRDLSVDYTDFEWRYTFGVEANAEVDYSLNKQPVPYTEDMMYWKQSNKLCCAKNRCGNYCVLVCVDENFHKSFSLNDVVMMASMTEDIYGECLENTLGENNYHITLHSNPEGIHLGNSSSANIIGGYGITFGNGCSDMTFGNNNHDMTFGNDCRRLTFGNYCDSLTFGNKCNTMTFGNDCYSLTFGNYCDSLTFGNYCGGITFGNGCWYFTFGNGCWYFTFGNDCYSLTFGNKCNTMTFGNNVHNGTVFDGVLNLEILGAEDSAKAVQNFVILTGTYPSGNNKAVVPFEKGKKYTQMAGINSAGNLAVWIPADVA